MPNHLCPGPVCQELVNEGWLLRVVLDLLKKRPEVETLVKLVERFLKE